jgi:acetyl-CoA carboxylase biotin carboxylase subunit
VFDTVLVANRGEIARRIVRTCHRLGIKAVTVHSEADAKALHAAEADESVLLGPADPAASYLDVVKVVEAARQTRAQAVHPGYGFLAERADFAQAVLDAGLAWIGPSPEVMAAMADKVTARNAMTALGVPVLPGTVEALTDADVALRVAREHGYPVMVKAAGGGGGIGMGVARDDDGLRAAFATAAARGARAFGSPAVMLERYVEHARHVEVQVLGLADGRVRALGERDCSIQRRHQKLVEETPAPCLAPGLRSRLIDAAVRAAEGIGYTGAGTVEFLVTGDELFFLEMNTRLQVEHAVTEQVYGLDLVEQQLLVAAGEEPSYDEAKQPVGHAIELRVCAEDPVTFRPSPGEITRWEEPAGEGVRVDSGCTAGDVVSPHYDSLLAKLIVCGTDRAQSLERARVAVAGFVVEGVRTTLPFFSDLLVDEAFVRGEHDTAYLEGKRRHD